MKAYAVQTAKRIEPFGDHPRDCLIANRSLARWQEAALRQIGARLVEGLAAPAKDDDGEHIVFGDSLYFTPEALAEFVARSRLQATNTICALKQGITTLRTIVATQDVRVYEDRVEYPLWYAQKSPKPGEYRPVVIEPDRMSETVPWPEHMLGHAGYSVPFTDRLVVGIDHWANLWATNIATLLAAGARLRKARKTRLLWLVLKARSTSQWKVLRQVNRIGHGCDIHSTAYLEGSIIGNDVRIGAGAVVRESVIGDRAYIGNNTTVLLSVVGERSVINDGAAVNYCVLYPGAFDNARFLNVSLMGRDTFLGEGATFSDYRFDRRSVTVIRDGAVVDTGNTFLGCCLGHGAYVGAGCLFAPGRAIPNGSRIVDDQRMIRKCTPAGPAQSTPAGEADANTGNWKNDLSGNSPGP